MRITVKVKPKSSLNAVAKTGDGLYSVYTNKPPLHGEANEAVCGLVAEYFGVPRTKVRVVFGKTAREKIIEIDAPNLKD